MRRSSQLADLAGRSYWCEDDARQVVDAWRQSGEPVSRFAGRLRIDPRRVSRWASRFESARAEAVRFLPVRVAAEGVDGRQASIEIEVGQGRRVRVAPGFATDDLRRVLAVLDEPRPC
jgi:Helix-turn-helix domain